MSIADNTAKWKAVKLTEFSGNALPVGFIHWSISSVVPAGEVPALGYLYNRVLYADLWQHAQDNNLVVSEAEWQAIASANDGNCAYYSSGDESTTFRVPCIKSWVKGASSIDEVGSYLEAGLPNITGRLPNTRYFTSNFRPDGAFALASTTYSQQWENGSTDTSTFNHISFDASRSSEIYGNSDTVQPPSLVGMFLIVAFGVAHNTGEADVADVMSAIERVQTATSDISDYIVESYRNGTEWYRVWKSGWVEQGGYVARSGSGGNVLTLTLLKEMKDNQYNAKINPTSSSLTNYSIATIEQSLKATTSIMVLLGSGTTGGYWEVTGQGA